MPHVPRRHGPRQQKLQEQIGWQHAALPHHLLDPGTSTRPPAAPSVGREMHTVAQHSCVDSPFVCPPPPCFMSLCSHSVQVHGANSTIRHARGAAGRCTETLVCLACGAMMHSRLSCTNIFCLREPPACHSGSAAVVQLGAAGVDTGTFVPRKCHVRRLPTSMAERMS